MTNKQVILKKYVVGVPNVEEHFAIIDGENFGDVNAITLGSHELLLKITHLSMDPYLRGRMRDFKGSYFPPFQEGKPIENFSLATVVKSGHAAFSPGDIVHGVFPWANLFKYSFKEEQIGWPFCKVVPSGLPITNYLGVLGMPGLTAWMGLMKICKPKKGETLFVSAGSGAVGQVVSQLGKRLGLRVVGCAGTDEKVALMLEKFGYDAAFNYKTCASDLVGALRTHCPNGIDCYYDNVGGEMLDAVLETCNRYCRIAACGAISLYNVDDKSKLPGLKNTVHLVFKSIQLEGFIVSDMLQKYGIKDALNDLTTGVKDGSIKVIEDIVKAPLDEAPQVFLRMMKGDNVGKQILEVQ